MLEIKGQLAEILKKATVNEEAKNKRKDTEAADLKLDLDEPKRKISDTRRRLSKTINNCHEKIKEQFEAVNNKLDLLVDVVIISDAKKGEEKITRTSS